MIVFSLAWRNLLRNRARSVATLMAIVIGCIAILLFGGYSKDIRYGLQMGFVRTSGHIQIQHRDYFLFGSGNPEAYGIARYEHVIDVVRHDPVLAPMLTVVTPTLQLGGIAGNFRAGVSRTVLATGVDVDGQNALRQWNDYGFAGRPPPHALSGTPADAAVVGVGVARVLQLCTALHVRVCGRAGPDSQGQPGVTSEPAKTIPDDLAALAADQKPATNSTDTRIELLAATARGAPNVASLEVVKAETQAARELDDVLVSMHLDQAQRLVYGASVPEVTSIVLQLHHTSQIPMAMERLHHLLDSDLKDDQLEVHDFTALNPSYGQTVALFSAIFGFIAVLIAVIVLFTIGNTMSMSVVERTAEIGTLRAMGLRRSGVRRMFICEGLLLGGAGVVIGTGAALVLAAIINHSGIVWTPPGRIDPVSFTVRVWGEVGSMLAVGIVLTAVSVLSSWWPAQRGARINVVDALRHA